MGLLESEIARIKYELGYNVLDAGADVYIETSALFEQVIQRFVSGGATTTSSTVVAASDTATAVALTLASATGFSLFSRVVVDVDAQQEIATVRSVAGNTITVLLSKAHSGTYPVLVEGAESIIRELLGQCTAISGFGGKLQAAASTAGIKVVDDIEFFGDSAKNSLSAQQQALLSFWRNELASALGIDNLRNTRGRAASGMVLY